jgi:hypothetical protein
MCNIFGYNLGHIEDNSTLGSQYDLFLELVTLQEVGSCWPREVMRRKEPNLGLQEVTASVLQVMRCSNNFV